MDPRRLLPSLAIATAFCLVLTAALVALRGSSGEPSDPGSAGAGAAAAPRTDATASAGPGSTAVRILAEWDDARSRAWARGDPSGLRTLYAPGSRTGALDAARLRRWTSRGLRVTGLRTQVLSLEVTARGHGRLDLVVTDRLVGGRAVGADSVIPLPVDRASTREVRLRRTKQGWVMVEARDQDRAAARTSETSSSSKS